VQRTNILMLVILTFAAFILVAMGLAELQSSLLQDYGGDPSPYAIVRYVNNN